MLEQATIANLPAGWVAKFQFPFRTTSHNNARLVPMAKHRAVRAEREALYFAWHGAGKPRPPAWPISVTFTRVAPRRLDEGDNLPSAFKGMRDELAKVLGLKGDGGAEVTWNYDQRTPQDLDLRRGTYHVIVEIEAPAGSPATLKGGA